MTGPRIRALPTAVLVFGVLLLAAAQAQAPMRPAGKPGGEPAANAPPKPLRNGQEQALPVPAGGPISVVPLGQPEGAPAGTMDAGSGGLGASLWAATPRAEAEALLDRLPVSSTVSPIRLLARRLLLTKAAAPVGEASHAFLTVRLRRLLDAGLLADAGQLARLGDVPGDPDYDRTRTEALLYAGDTGAVCGPDTARRNDDADPFWIRLRAYCYAAAGDEAAVALTRAILAARQLDDTAFDALLANVQSHALKAPPDIEAPDSLVLFLLRLEGLPVTLDTGLELGTPGVLMALGSKGNTALERLQAAERVVRTGALGGDDLIAIADGLTFSKNQFATEHAQVQEMPFLQGQALLRQAVRRAPPDVQPALIYEALSTAETKDLTGIAAILQHDALMHLPPNGADAAMAGLFARALMLTGEPDRAALWVASLSPALTNEAPIRARLLAALHLMAADPGRDAQLPAALDTLARDVTGGTEDAGAAALALGLYAALKEPLPPAATAAAEQSQRTAWPGRRPAPALVKRLAESLRAEGSRGAAISWILIAFGPQGPADMAPDATVRLVRDLGRLGLGQSAREIAISALLRYRPPPPPAPPAGSATL